MRTVIVLSVVTLFAATASAQYPGAPQGGYGGYPGTAIGGGIGYPGLYGGGLSPYLNLRRGGIGGGINNRAVNYYNFVRPYTAGTYGNAFVQPSVVGGAGRTPFFPNQVPVYADDEPVERQKLSKPDEKGVVRVDMPPAGHGGGFMNTQGYFGNQGGATLGRPTPRRR